MKIFCFFILSLQLSAFGSFLESEDTDEDESGKTYTVLSGGTYEGPLRKKKAHGYGLYVWPDGRAFQGNFKNGMAHGKGVYTSIDDIKYAGQFKNGKVYSYTVYNFAGKTYLRIFKKNKLISENPVVKTKSENQNNKGIGIIKLIIPDILIPKIVCGDEIKVVP